MLKNIIFVGLGGGTGAIVRYLVGLLTTRLIPMSRLPWGTFIVNIIGCFGIGLLYALVLKSNAHYPVKLLLITGFLGGFTTFSAFGNETFTFIRNGNIALGLGYALLSITLGLAAVWLGTACAPVLQGYYNA